MIKKSLSLAVLIMLLLTFFTTINTVGISYITLNQNNDEIVLTQWTAGYYIQSKKDNESCKLYCHIPVIHDGQSPIIITDVWSEPINKVSNYKIKQNYSGTNALLEISFEELSYDEILNTAEIKPLATVELSDAD